MTLFSNETHTAIWSQGWLTFISLHLLWIGGYLLLRFFSVDKLPPLLIAFSITALLIGCGLSVAWFIHSCNPPEPVMTVPVVMFASIQTLLMNIRLIRQVIYDWREKYGHQVYQKAWLSSCTALLTLLGQEPDAIIRMWTETSD